MTFERPDLLGLLPVLVLLLLGALLTQWRRGARLVNAWGGPEAARRLTGRRLERFPALRVVALVPAVACLLVAAAGPVPDAGEPPPLTPVDLIIAVDVSRSMSGADVEPSRIARGQTLVEQLVEAGVADRVSLSMFADWAFRLVPLTDDPDVVSFFAPWIVPELVNSRDQGTSMEGLLGHALESWRSRAREGTVPVVLVVSDGEDHGDPAGVIGAARALVDEGATVWTAGVGTGGGAPLFLPGSSAPLLDGSGQPVIAAYDPALLREIAEVGRGVFHDVSDDAGLSALIADLRDLSGRTETVTEPPPDRTWWLLLAGLLLLVVDVVADSGRRASGRRRGEAPEAIR